VFRRSRTPIAGPQAPSRPRTNRRWYERLQHTGFLILAAGFMLGALAVRLWDMYGPGSSLDEPVATLARAYEITHDQYVEKDKTDPKKLAYDAITGMVDGLGDTGHSRFLPPEQRKRDEQALQGKVVGIGVEVAERDGSVVVVVSYPDSPADRAGIRTGDKFLRVDGQDVSGAGLAGLGDRLRGPEGSEVHVAVLHPDDTVLDVTLRRAEVRIPFVTWAMIDGTSLLHIRISQFGENTASELDKALDAARDAHATGIVLDLRNNPGGLLDEAVGVVSRFVSDGVVLIERDRSGNDAPIRVKDDVRHVDTPLVVLVNGGSASASEVTAAALLEHGRAAVIGDRTFGTATVLRTFPLPDGSALLLGVREWLTPTGKPLRKVGVTPTEAVALPKGVEPLFPRIPTAPAEAACMATDLQLKAAIVRLAAACGT